MILYKLKDLECGLDPHKPDEAARLAVVRSLLELMLQIDHTTETVLDDSAEKVLSMLSFIKDAPLSEQQRQEIVRLLMG